jgi:hypothetical protein
MSTFELVLDKGAARELSKLLSLLLDRVINRDIEYTLLKNPDASVDRLERKQSLIETIIDQIEEYLDD